MTETKSWWDLVLDILLVLCFLPSQLGYCPVLLLFKQKPKWLEPIESILVPAEAVATETQLYLNKPLY